MMFTRGWVQAEKSVQVIAGIVFQKKPHIYHCLATGSFGKNPGSLWKLPSACVTPKSWNSSLLNPAKVWAYVFSWNSILAENTAPDLNSLKVQWIQCWEFASTHARGKGISCEALIPVHTLPKAQGSLGSDLCSWKCLNRNVHHSAWIKAKVALLKRERWLDQNAALSYLFHKNLPPPGQSGLMSMVNANHRLVLVSAAQSLNFTAFTQQWKITRNFLLGSGISLATAGQAYCNSIYALNSFRSLFFKICHSQRALGNYYKRLNLWPAGESKRWYKSRKHVWSVFMLGVWYI